MRYQAVIDPTNKNNSHTLTIDFITGMANNQPLQILDVGCSAGYLGEYLRTLGHHVTGLDITPEAIETAKTFLNEAYCLKVEDFLDQQPDRRFDVVIFGDVLEHVTNAEEVLKKTATALKPGGKVVASIPNVAHVAVRAMLLAGRWDYSELGLLDRDHVRFFTKETINQLFENTGFEVCETASTNLPLETVAEMCSFTLDDSCVATAQQMSRDDPSATVFQYVVKAQPLSGQPRVVCMVPDLNIGLFTFRIEQPLENWSRRYNGLVRYRTLGEFHPDDLTWGDVFVFQRIGGGYTLHLIKALQAHGKRVVFEIDDLLTNLPHFLAHHRGSKSNQASLTESIRLADVVTTTTERLASELRPLNTNVICVPNCIQTLPQPRQAHTTAPDAPITLLVGSSDKVLVDVLIEPLKQMQAKYGDRLRLMVIGPIDEALRKGGLEFERLPMLAYEQFTQLLQAQTNAIGLIPLDDSLFSSCKSPIKYFDYSVAQIPTICSNVPPYSDYIEHNTHGFLVENTGSAWQQAIDDLIQHPAKRRELSDAARQYVADTHMADRAGDAWQTVIETLEVERVDIPGLIDAAKMPFTIPNDPAWIAKRLFRPSTYARLRQIVSNEGVAGIKKRFVRW
jgi:2-polyprenyl-3-methyl-5-hydroxy-6-metoxy-1,4-benzoquinol methylase/glycosyltransferase involved in cell wall biosynthesis